MRFLLVSGKPLGEPIARYGPFVMNTREELMLALQDLQNDTLRVARRRGVGGEAPHVGARRLGTAEARRLV